MFAVVAVKDSRYLRSEMATIPAGQFEMGSCSHGDQVSVPLVPEGSRSGLSTCCLRTGATCPFRVGVAVSNGPNGSDQPSVCGLAQFSARPCGDWNRPSLKDGVLLANLYPTYQPSFGLTYDAKRRHFASVARLRRSSCLTSIVDRSTAILRSERESAFPPKQSGNLLHEERMVGDSRGVMRTVVRRNRCVAASEPPLCKDGRGPRDVGTSLQDRTPEGIYDLSGNMREWVLDRYIPRYTACVSLSRPIPDRSTARTTKERLSVAEVGIWSPQQEEELHGTMEGR